MRTQDMFDLGPILFSSPSDSTAPPASEKYATAPGLFVRAAFTFWRLVVAMPLKQKRTGTRRGGNANWNY